jgi:hypothetical protein
MTVEIRPNTIAARLLGEAKRLPREPLRTTIGLELRRRRWSVMPLHALNTTRKGEC